VADAHDLYEFCHFSSALIDRFMRLAPDR
jgi:hypothetical protein